jgi:site-specific recombinase XerD
MTNQLVLAATPPHSREAEAVALTPAQARLRKLVLDAVASPHSKRNYARALDDLFAFCASRPLTREVLLEWRAGMEALSPSTINVRLSAVRKLVHEARRNNMIGSEEAASLTDVPNIRQKGTRLGNWLTREQAKELLAVPDRSTLKGKRDYVILALLVGCALRRNELAELDVATIRSARGGGSWLTSRVKAGASVPSPFRSGSSRESTRG